MEVIKIDNLNYKEIKPLLDDLVHQNAKLVHPSIATIIDSGEFEGHPFFVYNFSPSLPLRRLFNQNFSWEDSSRELVAVTQAVAYAHQNGVIHGFLNPNSIILDENKNPYLFDFGFEQTTLNYIITRLPGTWINNADFAYCSPEQLVGEAIDGRSDVFAMGMILYEWMTGEIPYLKETALETLRERKKTSKQVIDTSLINVPEIEILIEKCISVNPADRYQSMLELSVLLARGALDIKITPKMVQKPLDVQVMPSRKKWDLRFALFLFISLIIVAVVGYSLRNSGIAQEIFSTSTPTASSTPTKQLKISTPTPTIIRQTSTPAPTATATIQFTQVPNKINYPVLVNTKLPSVPPPISSENASKLITITKWGIGEINRFDSTSGLDLLAVASPSGVYLYSTSNFVLKKYLDTSSWVTAVKFSGDGKKLAVGDKDGLIRVWDTSTWEIVANYSGHSAGILNLAFSPDGAELASVAVDGRLFKWLANGTSISKAVYKVTTVVYSSDGSEIITGGEDVKINRWKNQDLNLINSFNYSSKIIDMQINKKTNMLIIGGADRRVTVVDYQTSQISKLFLSLIYDVSSVTISPDGSMIVGADTNGGFVVGDAEGNFKWEKKSLFQGSGTTNTPNGISHSLAFSSDGNTLFSGLRSGTIRYFNTSSEEQISQSTELNSHAVKLSISPDSQYALAQIDNGEVKIWDLPNNKFLYSVVGLIKQGGVFSKNSRFFAVLSSPSTIKVYQTEGGKEIYNFNGLQNVQAIQFVHNDEFLAAGNNPIGRIFSLSSGQELEIRSSYGGTGCRSFDSLAGNENGLFYITSINFIPREDTSVCDFQKIGWMTSIFINEYSSQVAYAGNSKLGFVNKQGDLIEMSEINLLNFKAVASSPDGKLLAATLEDNSIRIWDAMGSKKEVMRLFGPEGIITDLMFSPNGSFLVTSSTDGIIRVWGVP